MKKRFLALLILVSCMFIFSANVSASSSKASNPIGLPVYRLYNKGNGDHYFTINSSEVNSLISSGWTYEYVAFYQSTRNDRVNIYCVYNPNSGEHFYTKNITEANNLIKNGWYNQGIPFYADSYKSTFNQAVFRLYNPNAKKADSHVYILSESEKNSLISKGWRNEGVAWYSDPQPWTR